MNKLVVYEDWVEMCQKYSTLLPPHAYRVQRKRLFIGKKICLSKLSVSDRKRLHFLITHYGGICTLKLDRTCTHLVTGENGHLQLIIKSRVIYANCYCPDCVLFVCPFGKRKREVVLCHSKRSAVLFNDEPEKIADLFCPPPPPVNITFVPGGTC